MRTVVCCTLPISMLQLGTHHRHAIYATKSHICNTVYSNILSLLADLVLGLGYSSVQITVGIRCAIVGIIISAVPNFALIVHLHCVVHQCK
jgi:hypothetical protein